MLWEAKNHGSVLENSWHGGKQSHSCNNLSCTILDQRDITRASVHATKPETSDSAEMTIRAVTPSFISSSTSWSFLLPTKAVHLASKVRMNEKSDIMHQECTYGFIPNSARAPAQNTVGFRLTIKSLCPILIAAPKKPMTANTEAKGM